MTTRPNTTMYLFLSESFLSGTKLKKNKKKKKMQFPPFSSIFSALKQRPSNEKRHVNTKIKHWTQWNQKYNKTSWNFECELGFWRAIRQNWRRTKKKKIVVSSVFSATKQRPSNDEKWHVNTKIKHWTRWNQKHNETSWKFEYELGFWRAIRQN